MEDSILIYIRLPNERIADLFKEWLLDKVKEDFDLRLFMRGVIGGSEYVNIAGAGADHIVVSIGDK